MTITYRPADPGDVAAMAEIRSAEWGTLPYWEERIRGYMTGELSPQKALRPRIVMVAVREARVAGLIAGHLTRRYGCDGELQWIDVDPHLRRAGIASELLRRLAEWFAEQQVRRVCVDVDPENLVGRSFYQRHGATPLNPHWLVWDDITKLRDGTR